MLSVYLKIAALKCQHFQTLQKLIILNKLLCIEFYLYLVWYLIEFQLEKRINC